MRPADPDKPVLLMRCSTEFEAGLRASTVRAAGLDARVIQAVSATLNFGAAMGAPFEVYVHRDDLEAAREAIAAAAAGQPIYADEPDAPEQTETEIADAPDGGDEAVEFVFGGGTAFVVGLAFGLFTLFVPFTVALMVKAPLSPVERNIFGVLWVLFFGMVGVVLRERFPFAARHEASERDDGRAHRHFRDSRTALVGWFLLGAGLLGPASFFFVGLLLIPLMQALAQHTALAQPLIFYGWCLLCGWWTFRHANKRRLARRAARNAPKLAR